MTQSRQTGRGGLGLLVALGFKDRLVVPWATCRKEHFALCPNMLLYWETIRHACAAGFSRFDFGRSTPGGSTYRFKEQWGAHPVPLYWYHWSYDGRPVPDVSPENSKYELAFKMWKKLPLPLTRLIGPSIVRKIP